MKLLIHSHDDVIKWKHFPRYWPFVRGIRRLLALLFSLIYAWTKGWTNSRNAGDLRRHCAHYDVIVMHAVLLYLSWSFCPLLREKVYDCIIACTHESSLKWTGIAWLVIYCNVFHACSNVHKFLFHDLFCEYTIAKQNCRSVLEVILCIIYNYIIKYAKMLFTGVTVTRTTTWCHKSWLILIQLMACHQFSARLLP